MTLLEALLEIREALPILEKGHSAWVIRPYLGICPNVSTLLDFAIDYRELRQLIDRWPGKYSEDEEVFPVGGEREYYDEGSLKYINPKRIALLNWLIEELQK